MNTNYKVIGLTQLRIKTESRALESRTLTTWPSELLKLQGSCRPSWIDREFSAAHASMMEMEILQSSTLSDHKPLSIIFKCLRQPKIAVGDVKLSLFQALSGIKFQMRKQPTASIQNSYRIYLKYPCRIINVAAVSLNAVISLAVLILIIPH